MTEDERTELELNTGIGGVSYKGKRMAEVIAVICLTLLSVLTYILWEHKDDTKSIFRELTVTSREQNRILREQLCLLSLPPEKREREFMSDGSFCKRLAREQ